MTRKERVQYFLKDRVAMKEIVDGKVRELQCERQYLCKVQDKLLMMSFVEKDPVRKEFLRLVSCKKGDDIVEVDRQIRRWNAFISDEKRVKVFDVDEIKDTVKIADIMPMSPGYTSRGRDKYLCPLHEEKTPSFIVFKNADGRERWHCFGACGEGGDVISLYMKLNGCDFKTACGELYKIRYG